MKLYSFLLGAVAAAAFAGIASAQSAPTASEPKPASAPASAAAHKGVVDPGKDPNQVICKPRELTGSRLPSAKICHTRQEWADIEIETHRQVEHMQVMGSTQSQ